MILRLERFAYTPLGVFGWLKVGDETFCTVERPWIENKPFVSCIPEGCYELAPTRYNRGGYRTLEVADVEGRTDILLHRGNTYADVQGCIAIGTEFGPKGDMLGVWNSRIAWSKFVNCCGVDVPHILDIRATAQGRLAA